MFPFESTRPPIEEIPSGAKSEMEQAEMVCMLCHPDRESKCVYENGTLRNGWFHDQTKSYFRPVKCFTNGCIGGRLNGTCA